MRPLRPAVKQDANMFEKFEIIDCLKKDEFTSVYLANHIYLGKKIIVKTLNTQNLPDKTVLKRFQREAKILAGLSHPNIIRVLDFGTQEADFYISFEYFESGNLRKVIRENGLIEEQKYHLMAQLLAGLNFAHQQQIIHRDIKPENILVNDAQHLKIADFGLALVLTEEQITHKSSIVGTPSYMSPEQIRGEKLSARSDIFSSGILLFELFGEQHPFLGNDVSATINNILQNQVAEISAAAAIPEPVKPIIRKMLEKDRRQRFGSVKEIMQSMPALPEFSGAKGAQPLPFDSKHRRRTIQPWMAMTILLIMAAAVSAVVMNRSGPAEQSNLQLPVELPDSSFHSTVEPLTSEPADTILQEELRNKTSQTKAELLAASKSAEMMAPETNQEESPAVEAEIAPNENLLPAKLFVQCLPWADIYIDNKKIETTPLETEISMVAGEYVLQLRHPNYPAFEQTMNLKSGEFFTMKVDLDTMFGYLNCNVYPWGDVFIDNIFHGQTPLKDYILLAPGKHQITIKNPQFDTVHSEFILRRREAIEFRLNLEDGRPRINRRETGY